MLQMFTKMRSFTRVHNVYYKMVAKLGLKPYTFGKIAVFYHQGAQESDQTNL